MSTTLQVGVELVQLASKHLSNAHVAVALCRILSSRQVPARWRTSSPIDAQPLERRERPGAGQAQAKIVSAFGDSGVKADVCYVKSAFSTKALI